jgi:probable rRNA maturation factor
VSVAAESETLEIDVRVADPRWQAALGDIEALARRVLGHASLQTTSGGEVSILMTSDSEMRDLNRRWRGIDKPTDVLSFPGKGPQAPDAPVHIGDIALAFETSQRDAEEMNRPFDGHVSHLLVHGFLHLLGYDHIEPEDAALMEPLEASILAGLGWPDPYAAGPYASGET